MYNIDFKQLLRPETDKSEKEFKNNQWGRRI